jgi:AraC-like DNA-binding protein
MDSPVKVAFFKMKMRILQPDPSISNYVSNIVVLEDGDLKNDILIPLIARGYPSIAFQATGASGMDGKNNVADSLVLYGQNVKPFQFHASRHLTIIAYFLYPHILKTFFGFGANEVTELCIDLSQSQPARIINLKQQLIDESSLAGRLLLMNRYVLKLSELIRTDPDHSILFATKAIQKRNGLISLKNIEKELHVTERTLQRSFKLHVGVSPKVFSRICQFQSAFQQISNGEPSKLSDIAYENGFADQSHLNRSFKEFTNCSPGDYLKLSAGF